MDIMVAATCLAVNGYDLDATDADVVTAVAAPAAGRLSEAALSA